MELNLASVGIAAAVSIVAALTSEAVNWYMIYRHEEYKKLVKDNLN